MQADDAGDRILYTHNDATGRMMFINLETNELLSDFYIKDVLPDWCTYADGSQSCFLLGGGHQVVDDHDYVLTGAIRLDNWFTNVTQISVQDEEPVWNLDQVDFSSVTNNGSCSNTCGDGQPVDASCRMLEVHGLEILQQDLGQQWVEVLVTDPMNARVENVRLDYRNGNTCGQAQWVLDSSHPDWPPAGWPNSVQYLDLPEGKFVLISFYDQQPGAVGAAGRIMLWDLNGERPEKVWAYPSDASSARPYLMEPHGARIGGDTATGHRYLTYGHSSGLAKYYGDHTSGGTVGLALADNLLTVPDYLGEWTVPTSLGKLDFPREFEVLPDGRVMATDAGCFWISSPDQSCPGEVYILDPRNTPMSPLPGIWSKSHLTQNVVGLSEDEVVQEVNCGFQLLFEADYIEADGQGQELRSALTAGGPSCADQ